MDFFGHHITQFTLTLGPMIILLGVGQFCFYKFFVSYSDRTVEELSEKSFLGLAGTSRTMTGGKITALVGLIIFVIMFFFRFFLWTKN